jgi:hypothetical protein
MTQVCDESDSDIMIIVLWPRYEKSLQVLGREAMRMRTVLLLNIPLSHTQSHFKSPMCCVSVHVTSDR